MWTSNFHNHPGTQHSPFIARRRHLEALKRTEIALQQAHNQLYGLALGELMAEDLRAAQEALGEITGEFTADDLLGKIFSSFLYWKIIITVLRMTNNLHITPKPSFTLKLGFFIG